MTLGKRRKDALKLAIKAALVAALLYFLAQKDFISVQATRRALTRWEHTLPAVGALILTSLLGVLRWQWLLRAQGIRLSLLRTFQLTYIGNFFNIALPGAVSGDFVKAFYVGREIEGQRARAFGSILFDRVAGLSALVLVSAFALVFGIKDFYGTPLFRTIRVIMALAAIAVVAFYAYLFLVRERHDPLLLAFRRLERRLPKLGTFRRIYEGLRHYHDHRLTVINVLALSVLVHLIVGWACLSFARALGDEGVPLLSAYVVVPLGLLVTAVPVMPAGVGTGHAAFSFLFPLIGSERGGDVFTFLALTNILIGVAGGLVYLKFRGHEPRPPLEEAEESPAPV